MRIPVALTLLVSLAACAAPPAAPPAGAPPAAGAPEGRGGEAPPPAPAAPEAQVEDEALPAFRAEAFTLEDALAVGRVRSPALRTARRRLRLAEAGVVTARQLPFNPVVTAQGATDYLFKREDENRFSVGLSQTFETGGQRGRRSELAEAAVRAAEAAVKDAERRFRRDAALAFFDLLLATRRLEIARASVELRGRILEIAEARARAGDIPEVDANLVRLELRQAEAERAAAAREVDVAGAGLRAIIGLGEAAGLKPAGEFPAPAGAQPLDLTARALAARPDLAALRHERQAAGARVDLERASVSPDVTLEVFYDYEEATAPGVPIDVDNLIGVAVAVPIPIFNRRQGEILEAERAVALVDAELRALEVEVRRQIEVAAASLARAVERADTYEKDIVPLAERNLELNREAYRLGQVGTLEVLRAEEEAIKVRAARVEALRDRAAALADLEAATGGEP